MAQVRWQDRGEMLAWSPDLPLGQWSPHHPKYWWVLQTNAKAHSPFKETSWHALLKIPASSTTLVKAAFALSAS